MIIGSHSIEEEGSAQSGSEPRVTFHLGEVAFLSVPLHGGAAMDVLTQAEREVAVLAAAGLSNLAIARCRGRALRTVAKQMASVMDKVHASSRHDLRVRLALCPPREDAP